MMSTEVQGEHSILALQPDLYYEASRFGKNMKISTKGHPGSCEFES